MTAAESADFRFAYQGVAGAFSHRAAQVFAESQSGHGPPSFQPCQTFAEVFHQVISGGSGYGVIPLENSTIGTIVANFDLLWREPVSIISELSIAVHHHLLGLAGADIKGITEVYSHPAALDQCRVFFSLCPWLKPVSYFDTSGAARMVAERGDPAVAAIAGEFAAREYDLAILKSHLEDSSSNQTRFAIIVSEAGDGDAASRNLPQLPYKISCAVELPHKPGSLARLLARLADLQVNLTKIESRPIIDVPWHYRFFIDMELNGSEQDRGVVAALSESTDEYKLLGRYSTVVDASCSAR